MVSGYAWDGKERDFYQKNWLKFTKPFKTHKIPYAYSLGNHDSEANFSRIEISNLD